MKRLIASMPSPRTIPGQLAFFMLALPLFAVFGVWVLVRAARNFQLALRRELACPNGHTNTVSGRWECAACKAVYMGWVGRCDICGAGASWFPCKLCGVSIPLPWERR